MIKRTLVLIALLMSFTFQMTAFTSNDLISESLEIVFESCEEEKLIPKQSLAQFVVDVSQLDGIRAALDTLAKYSSSDRFYLDKKEMYQVAHNMIRNNNLEFGEQILDELPVYFPKLKSSLAHTLFELIFDEGNSSAKEWLQIFRNNSEFYLDRFELDKISQTLFDINKIPEARLANQIYLDEFPEESDAHQLMAEICLQEGSEKMAMQHLHDLVAGQEYISFLQLASRNSSTYIPTVLPRDTTKLFVKNGNKLSDTVFLFVQGGPMPDISAYHPRPLSLLPNQNNYLIVDVLQAQMINRSILTSVPVLTNEQSLYEHNVNAEMLHRTVKYFKNQGKVVFVIGHSYGCFISYEYLHSKENIADKLIFMGADPDEDMRNFQSNVDGTRKFIRWRNGNQPYETNFWNGFPLRSILQDRMEGIFSNTEILVSAHAKQRFTKLLEGKDLSNVIFYHAKFDEANGRVSDMELEFFKAQGAICIETYGDHHSMIKERYMENIYNHLVKDKPLKRSLCSALEDDLSAQGIEYALKSFEGNRKSNLFFAPVESELNALGYQLVAQGKLEEALQVFLINVNEFPNSWNVYDSLGETYLALGNLEKGKNNYTKSLSLHPGNIFAIKALRS